MKSLDEITADIAASAAAAQVTPELREALTAFAAAHAVRIRELRILAVSLAAEFVEASPGEAWDAAMRTAADELMACAAFVVRALKRRAGETMSSGRFAIVAYALADEINALPGFEAAEAVFESERPVRYEDYYNRSGMMLDEDRPRFWRLREADRRALLDEHHRRTTHISQAYAERGEVLDFHDPRVSGAAS